MRLTTEVIQAARYEGESRRSKKGRLRWSQHTIWDEAVPALGLRISHTGRKTFVVAYRAAGRKRQKTLGTIQEITLDTARRQAIELASAEAPDSRSKTPPSRAADASPRLETVAELCETYIQRHARRYERSWRQDQMLVKRYIVPLVGIHRLEGLRDKDIGKLRVRAASVYRQNTREITRLLNAIFAWGAEQGYWGENANLVALAADPITEEKLAAEPVSDVEDSTSAALPDIEMGPEVSEPTEEEMIVPAPEPTPVPLPTPVAPSQPIRQIDPTRFEPLTLIQPFDCTPASWGRIVDLTTETMEIETTFGLQIGKSYPFEIRDTEHTVWVETTVLTCRLARTMRTPRGDHLPLYRARLKIYSDSQLPLAWKFDSSDV